MIHRTVLLFPFILPMSACVAIRPSPGNTRSDRPDIYLVEERSSWVGVSGSKANRNRKGKVFFAGRGFEPTTSKEVDPANGKEVASSKVQCVYEDFEPAKQEAQKEQKVLQCELVKNKKKLVGIWITPSQAESFNGSEFVCLGKGGCSNPQKERGFRLIRIYDMGEQQSTDEQQSASEQQAVDPSAPNSQEDVAE